MTHITCTVCSFNTEDASLAKCPRCGVILGDPFEQVFAELDKYEEGCEPRSTEELRCNCGKEDGKIQSIEHHKL